MARQKTLVITFVFFFWACTAEASTIGDLVRAAEQAALSAGLEQRNAEAAKALRTATATLRDARVLDEDITEFVERYVSPDAVALAHRRSSRYRPGVAAAIDTIKQVKVLLERASVATLEFLATVRELQVAEQTERLNWDLESLRRLERKYGPDSAKLNGIEVLLAYVLQRSPAFGVNASGRPGPLELVFAYVPAYVTRSDEKMRLIGVAEIGLRQYFFKQGWGDGSGRLAWLKPGYMSYGVAWSSRSDDPLTPPWRGQSKRFGAFVGWGSLKVAWLGGKDQRILVTQQFQLMPWVF